MEYKDFINSKRHLSGEFGFIPNYVPDIAFDFQAAIIEKAIVKGRMAVFADTGLGKTLIQISIANNIIRETNKRVIILTPLAVAFQFIKEANKLGIDDIEYSKDGKFTKNIVICNYERLHYFNSTDFVGVICDESSILKNFNGKIKTELTAFMRKIPYRYISSATPSPNDFTELGTSSEVLGYMGYMDMLSKFFKNNQNDMDSNNMNIGDRWYLKPHAERDFFAWVNQWAMMIKKPSDLGFSDERYNLPELITNNQIVINKELMTDGSQQLLFAKKAKTMTEVKNEQVATYEARCQKAVELASDKTSVYWCNLNNESSLLAKLDPDAIEIRGAMTIEQKEDILINFAEGNIKRIITKAKMTGQGLNWQHCNHAVFFPTWSYEQYYQSIRRFWRFGQTKPVTIDLVISEGQGRVIEALQQKTKKAQDLYENLTKNVNSDFNINYKEFNKELILPNFI
jgi:hypothetical protein